MSNVRQALVLHLAGTNQPLLIEVAAEAAGELAGRLPELVGAAGVESIAAANGMRVAVDFRAVQVAFVDEVSVVGKLYGSPPRER
jgi:hypothetical protein